MNITGKKEEKITLVLFAAALVLIAIAPVASAAWDSSEVNFEVRLSETACNNNGDIWLYPDGTSSNSLNNCKLGVDSTTKTCCPLGYNCEQSAGNWNCVANATFTCFDYKTQGACNNYAETTAKNSIYRATGKECGSFEYASGADCIKQIVSCKCEWSSSNNRCDSKYSINKNCSDGTGGILGACAFNDGGSTGCDEDIMLLKWSASWSGSEADKPAECADGNKQISCRPTIKLPFFTLLNGITVIAVIMLIYMIYAKKVKRCITKF
ncbi:hypothetical protein HYT26_00250 [Candidatus Pacearchaeota archaeon]|nr:hypothetical protein [Candidatus Pacearchaeota archaeon]